MPSSKKQCPCPRCNNRLVDPKTFRAHQALLRESQYEEVDNSTEEDNDKGLGAVFETREQIARPRKRVRIHEDLENVGNKGPVGEDTITYPDEEMNYCETPPPLSSPVQDGIDDGNHVSPIDDLGFADWEEDTGQHGTEEDNNDEDEVMQAKLTAASFGIQLGESDSDHADDDLLNSLDEQPEVPSRIESVRITQSLLDEIQSASLENGKLPPDVIYRLRNPSEGVVEISDEDTRLSIDLYSACSNASESTYNAVRTSIQRCFPSCDILSLHSVKKLIAETSSVISVQDDMCIQSCHAFVGPYADLNACKTCNESRYTSFRVGRHKKDVPRQQACTIPLGPQIQALRRSPKGAASMRYRDTKLAEIKEIIDELICNDDMVYDDIFCGSDLLKLSDQLKITVNDTTVMFSIDGAQLYQSKKSDTWIGIWIVTDYNPQTRYQTKHVLPAFIIPGPNKPKDIDSFMFRSFHHLSAIQRENGGRGIRVWDALQNKTIDSRIIFIFGTADAVGLTELDGRVGHHGAQGCRLGCDFKGRHKPLSGHYYSAHLRPNDNTVVDCNHRDFDLRKLEEASTEKYQDSLASVVQSQGQRDYERNRKATGISKPSILSGLKFMLPVPRCFSVDLMHLFSLNMGDLLINLWRGDKKLCSPTDSIATWDWAVLKGDIWEEFGERVAAATKFFPSSFHRPPRNPVEKISSGYKSTEFYLLLYGLGVAFLRLYLPKRFWQNFCKFVRGVRLTMQRRITLAQVKDARHFLIQFVEEFENIYYQRRMDRLQFACPVLHSTLHVAHEIPRVGNGCLISQFTMERMVGDLGKGIRQPSNPFSNLCHLALRKSQLNALKVICPDLDHSPTSPYPRYSLDIGGGYVYLRPQDRRASLIEGSSLKAIENSPLCHRIRYQRWGRIRLPNHQVARSLFSEAQRPSKRQENARVTRNVKLILEGRVEYGEVQFYFLEEGDPNQEIDRRSSEPDPVPLALVALYKRPDPDILANSFETVWACKRGTSDDFCVVSILSIVAVVSMQPLPAGPGEAGDLWFVIEKSGLEDLEVLSSDSFDNIFDI